ncbi:hypothetical protein SAMD00019534_098300 [Acytostelium subglobosum LB1]|uniref:hypothetical protein n=1 Tax=Acytostelium subglobosum LB1 TaxID=1410327 RepID=UPI000644D5F7|nr:hypothetical protein SAMD00019534_098300 [Acytostelium subglobosum LB1]GAM26655.1 hypothetical protein SAMD00019534_098300 [Acytostelium subglobosum LB1]|eukprot:XP_012750316.1 hypothetical protein SAMD00019534_098300 [Acytostelium subglobosum LB1]
MMYNTSSNRVAIVGAVLLCVALLACAQPGPTPQAIGPFLVPYPQHLQQGEVTLPVDPKQFTIATTSSSQILKINIQRYQKLFFSAGPAQQHTSAVAALTLNINVASDNEDLFLGVDESYSIVANSHELTITANTVYGAVRALETFSQLITFARPANTYSIQYTPITIKDYPRFQWRGMLVDSGRHYLPVDFILHILDTLAYAKFNVLHWHIVDAQSFPVQSSTYPDLTNGAYNPIAIYTHDQIQQVIAYGKTYGIRVVPEFDIPGHSASWGVGYPQLLASCPSYASNTNNLLLNIADQYTYTFIKNLFTEITPLFPDNYFHTGGDEVILDCWSEDPSIVAWMTQNNYSLVEAEQYFETQMSNILASLNRTKIVWNDPYINGVQLDQNTVIQVWDVSNVTQQIINNGFKAIVANAYYLDKQVPSPFNKIHYEWQDTWQDFYSYDPMYGITENGDNILGAEACMWGDQLNQVQFDVQVWPRSLAIAERFWSNEAIVNIDDALVRIEAQSCSIAKRGVNSGPLFPDFCFLPADVPSGQHPILRLTPEQVASILRK